MHVGEDTANGNEDDKDEHENIKDGAGGLGFDVFGEENHNEKKDGGNNHDVTGRKGGLAGAVRASVPDEDFIKNKIDGDHKSEGEESPEEFLVDFF